jgi:hypothetical protein
MKTKMKRAVATRSASASASLRPTKPELAKMKEAGARSVVRPRQRPRRGRRAGRCATPRCCCPESWARAPPYPCYRRCPPWLRVASEYYRATRSSTYTATPGALTTEPDGPRHHPGRRTHAQRHAGTQADRRTGIRRWATPGLALSRCRRRIGSTAGCRLIPRMHPLCLSLHATGTKNNSLFVLPCLFCALPWREPRRDIAGCVLLVCSEVRALGRCWADCSVEAPVGWEKKASPCLCVPRDWRFVGLGGAINCAPKLLHRRAPPFGKLHWNSTTTITANAATSVIVITLALTSLSEHPFSR